MHIITVLHSVADIISNSCNMGAGICLICMPEARGLRAYISGESRAPMLQVMCITSGTLKIYPNLQAFALPIYITMSIRFDHGILRT